MSLRGRLTLLYTSLVGGILLLFGVAVYGAVSFTLTSQVDETLRNTVNQILANTHVDSIGELSVITLPLLDLPTDVYVQVWGHKGELRGFSPNMAQVSESLDNEGLKSAVPVFREVLIRNTHLRVLTVPLQVGGRLAGSIQVASKLSLVDATQQTLLFVLVAGAFLSITIAGVAVWLSTHQALAPLEDVTRVALHVTRADDLSRRIPYQGLPGDEIGQLIHAFNQTLSRLENLFNTQRRFMADVGHELRTPLTVIKGNVDLMRRIGESDDESLCSIESEVDRLTRLVGDLLLLAQAESGRIPLDHRVVELDTLTLDVLNQMNVLTREKHLALRLGEFDQVLVCGDNDRLKQVLVNLLGNAIQYTPVNGEVMVGVGKQGNQGRITITDNGPGIPAADLPHIFERFYRGQKARTRPSDRHHAAEVKGFGLGLSIAYWIVRNHGGRIEVNSTEGVGTTFCVWLPLAEGNCHESAPSAS